MGIENYTILLEQTILYFLCLAISIAVGILYDMRIHALDKIYELKKLRRKGYSINELVAKLSIPKTTVWHHVHDVQILPQYVSQWNAKRGGSIKRTERNWVVARDEAKKLLQSPKREFLVALAMLYWSEGSKKACEFINSDGKMIKIYLAILRKVLKIPEEMLQPTMRIFSGMNEANCLAYWSHVTGIPRNHFIIRLNDGGTKGRTTYGMCRITVRKGSHFLKLIHSLIEQTSEEFIKVI